MQSHVIGSNVLEGVLETWGGDGTSPSKSYVVGIRVRDGYLEFVDVDQPKIRFTYFNILVTKIVKMALVRKYENCDGVPLITNRAFWHLPVMTSSSDVSSERIRAGRQLRWWSSTLTYLKV